jgi:hypothetical protein
MKVEPVCASLTFADVADVRPMPSAVTEIYREQSDPARAGFHSGQRLRGYVC